MENTSNTARIIIPKNPWNIQNSEELLHTLWGISNEDIARIWVAIEETERKREEEKRRKEEEKKNRKIYAAQELKDYRKEWKEKIVVISDTTKEKIIQAAENIPVKVDKDEDWSRLIEFKLWWKTRKILDPKLKTHSDDAYSCIIKWNEWGEQVATRWMRGNIDEWKNQKLKEYVHEKMEKWLHVADYDIHLILQELGNLAGISGESEQIAMFMYLTGMDWHYYLRPWDNELICSYISRYFCPCEETYDSYSKLFMISVSEE